MVKIRTKKGKNGKKYRYPVKQSSGSSRWIQKSIKHPGRVTETIQRWYGKEAFDDKGRIKPKYLIKAKQKAKEEQAPGRKAPYRVLRKKDGKTYVKPDATLIRTEEVHEQAGIYCIMLLL